MRPTRADQLVCCFASNRLWGQLRGISSLASAIAASIGARAAASAGGVICNVRHASKSWLGGPRASQEVRRCWVPSVLACFADSVEICSATVQQAVVLLLLRMAHCTESPSLAPPATRALSKKMARVGSMPCATNFVCSTAVTLQQLEVPLEDAQFLVRQLHTRRIEAQVSAQRSIRMTTRIRITGVDRKPRIVLASTSQPILYRALKLRVDLSRPEANGMSFRNTWHGQCGATDADPMRGMGGVLPSVSRAYALPSLASTPSREIGEMGLSGRRMHMRLAGNDDLEYFNPSPQ